MSQKRKDSDRSRIKNPEEKVLKTLLKNGKRAVQIRGANESMTDEQISETELAKKIWKKKSFQLVMKALSVQ